MNDDLICSVRNFIALCCRSSLTRILHCFPFTLPIIFGFARLRYQFRIEQCVLSGKNYDHVCSRPIRRNKYLCSVRCFMLRAHTECNRDSREIYIRIFCRIFLIPRMEIEMCAFFARLSVNFRSNPHSRSVLKARAPNWISFFLLWLHEISRPRSGSLASLRGTHRTLLLKQIGSDGWRYLGVSPHPPDILYTIFHANHFIFISFAINSYSGSNLSHLAAILECNCHFVCVCAQLYCCFSIIFFLAAIRSPLLLSFSPHLFCFIL